MTPKARARVPVPTIPTVSSRPGRKVSTNTGCRNRSKSAVQTASRAVRDETLLVPEIPLLVPSATGFAITGHGRATDSRSSRVSTMVNSGVGIPKDRTTCLVMPLCKAKANTRGSEKVYESSKASSGAGTWASRPMPCKPSAILNTRSHRSP